MAVYYPYAPLNLIESSIRVLRIQKGWWPDTIICQLCESYADHDKGIPYQALSYTWGGTQYRPRRGLPSVLVDGHEIPLTGNLYWALRHIRKSDQDVVLWVDAICINQRDPVEKGHQVKLMGHVYKGAEEVIIWLGRGDDRTGSLLDLIDWVDCRATETQAMGNKEHWAGLCRRFLEQRWKASLTESKGDLPQLKQTLAEVLAQPWFRRVWILQEVANARTARIQYGLHSCAARAFALMPQLFGVRTNTHVQAILDIMPRFRKGTWWSKVRRLDVLLHKFAASEALIPRDKIYAMLSMSTDACDPDIFYPCYRKPDDQVYRDTGFFMLFGKTRDPTVPFPRLELSDLLGTKSRVAGHVLAAALQKVGGPRCPWRSLISNIVLILNNGIERKDFKLNGVLAPLAKMPGCWYCDRDSDRKGLCTVHRIVLPEEKVDHVAVSFDQVEDRLVFMVVGNLFWPPTMPVGPNTVLKCPRLHGEDEYLSPVSSVFSLSSVP
ncbi:heterokaryon incompatibility protein-domain-containing protein [Dichotomopilus funicola]|uniref:Heterokaryon incompatibility protein-domain-containing protein n=1 Tax=Dichotomopilus funicola TaxID=1934379 RepID=A0AAN6V7G0_9PEZI|nr:heterokaryon incompatibility protein-domain-containing protein [Dichotomopilus funicola]